MIQAKQSLKGVIAELWGGTLSWRIQRAGITQRGHRWYSAGWESYRDALERKNIGSEVQKFPLRRDTKDYWEPPRREGGKVAGMSSVGKRRTPYNQRRIRVPETGNTMKLGRFLRPKLRWCCGMG